MTLTYFRDDCHQPSDDDAPPWRNRSALSVAETAIVFGRSASWVRDRLTDRSLEAADRPSGPTAVTVGSIGALQTWLVAQNRRSRSRRARLRLVVDNT